MVVLNMTLLKRRERDRHTHKRFSNLLTYVVPEMEIYEAIYKVLLYLFIRENIGVI